MTFWKDPKIALPPFHKNVLIYGYSTCGQCEPDEPITRIGYLNPDDGKFYFGEFSCGCNVIKWAEVPNPEEIS